MLTELGRELFIGLMVFFIPLAIYGSRYWSKNTVPDDTKYKKYLRRQTEHLKQYNYRWPEAFKAPHRNDRKSRKTQRSYI